MSQDSGPIFIGGLSGSGKTQLRIALGAHPDISMTRRTYLWNRFYARFGALRDPSNLDRCLSVLSADRDVQRLDPDWRHIRRELREGEPTYARLFGLLHEHHARRLGKRRWGEQLRFVECFTDRILEAFPTARLIHMVRHPDMSAMTRGRLGWEIARWLHSAEHARKNCRRYPENYRVVRYEALAAQPADTVRECCGFIGEPFVPALAAVVATLRFDAPEHLEPNKRTASFIDLYAAHALMDLGYEREAGPAHERLANVLRGWPLNRATMAAYRATQGCPHARRTRA